MEVEVEMEEAGLLRMCWCVRGRRKKAVVVVGKRLPMKQVKAMAKAKVVVEQEEGPLFVYV